MSRAHAALAALGPRPARLLALALLATALLVLYLFSSLPTRLAALVFAPRPRRSCPPRAWAAGNWTPAPAPRPAAPDHMSTPRDALAFAGFEGCASDREFFWHLASDTEQQWDRWPAVTSWQWSPSDECRDLRPLDPAAMIKDMVEQGGWLLIGDSVTENHFFSLSCLLYPHVRATPNYTENPYFDRAWPQHLYLSPSSPLLPHLRPPAHFDAARTPLVSFRRVDLLLAQDELAALHAELHAEPPAAALFGDERAWSMPPAEYVDAFLAGGYGTLVASTGGHWTTTLFAGLRDEDAPPLYGIGRVLELFGHAMRRWAGAVQARLDEAREREGRGARKRQVVVRAYLPGHEDCHAERAPWAEYRPFRFNWYNWASIGDFNAVFEDVLDVPAYPDIHFLPIDRPALLRPDAHATGDCLHIMSGAGVLEGWSHYIWHFVTRELPGRMR
ncbi:hypothetical protein AcV5_006854 [Taiwanofungus camphoratus]|nr:hypothetical protein AcV5_006854 [Antrodia cinnamomea]